MHACMRLCTHLFSDYILEAGLSPCLLGRSDKSSLCVVSSGYKSVPGVSCAYLLVPPPEHSQSNFARLLFQILPSIPRCVEKALYASDSSLLPFTWFFFSPLGQSEQLLHNFEDSLGITFRTLTSSCHDAKYAVERKSLHSSKWSWSASTLTHFTLGCLLSCTCVTLDMQPFKKYTNKKKLKQHVEK